MLLLAGFLLTLHLAEGLRFRSLSCPKYCSRDIAPVCGDDGKIYKNDCERRKINCGDSSDKVREGRASNLFLFVIVAGWLGCLSV